MGMAVLSEPADGTHASGGELCVSVSATIKTHRRIATALGDRDLGVTVLRIADPSALDELDDPTAITVLACDPDRPDEMAMLRRARRDLRKRPIIVVSPVATGTGVRRALDAGADAIVFEPELESTLAVAVRAVASGQSVVPRKLLACVARPAFSHRERQVLKSVSKGLTNAQIAEQLFLSESTIKSHLSSAFAKFGVRSRREAAMLFLELEAGATGALANPDYLLTDPTSG